MKKIITLTLLFFAIFSFAQAPNPAPNINNFTPTNGCAGTKININGSNLNVYNITSIFICGQKAASYTAVSSSQIIAVVGAAPTNSDSSIQINFANGPWGIPFTLSLGGFIYAPPTALTIAGTSTVCQGQNDVFYVANPAVPFVNVVDATSYQWTLPSGAVITTPTKTIRINYGANEVSGNITVKGVNGCGPGQASSLAIIVNPLPSSAGVITGATTMCQAQNAVVYSVPTIANATSYQWTLPIGATGTSTTNSISVNYGLSAVSGNITVKGVNSCGTGVAATLPITVIYSPITAGVITGSKTVCVGQNAVIYSIPAIANATSYQWSLPSGATGTSTTNKITVSYGLSATSGDIAVRGVSGCGNGLVSSLAITIDPLPSTAGVITGPTTVCQQQNNVVYSVPVIANATSYQWTLPSGVTGTSTTNSITVFYLSAAAGLGSISVKGVNACGSGPVSTLAITINPIPSGGYPTTGPTTVCRGQTVIYSTPVWPNATSYEWALPFGATGTSTTNSISVYYGSASVSGTITLYAINNCAKMTNGSMPIAVYSTPSSAGAISGNATVCRGNFYIYGVPIIPNATSYEWVLPSGATGTSTTNTITVDYGVSAVSGNISVRGISNCGSIGQASNKSIMVASAQPISSPIFTEMTTSVPPGQNAVLYSVSPLVDALSYQWSLPSGATGSSTTNSIIVNYGIGAISGNITVRGVNGCGTGSATILPVSINLSLPIMGAITGSSTVCQGQNSVVYSVPVNANVTSYQWTLPSGATGSINTNTITINYTDTAFSGYLSVKGINSNGTGVSTSLAITVNSLPLNTGVITGSATVCLGQNAVIYSIPAIVNATSYQWTLPSGAAGTSTTNSINVNYGLSAVSGNITVKGVNSCGIGVASTYTITVNPLPSNAGTITGTTTSCQGQNAVVYNVPTIANATSYQWTLPSGAAGTSTSNNINVNYGLSAVSGNITVKGVNSCGAGPISTLAVTVNNTTPSSPGAISGIATVCAGQNAVVYSVPAIANATSYQWTLPSGATGTSTTNSIGVDYGLAAVSGNISVKGVNSCGAGVASVFAVNVINCSLPSNNFKLEVTDPTCQTKANGKLKITATASYNYTATMDGVNYTFTNNILDIANLAPKTYTICIKVPALNNYTQCFEFTVKSAPGLTAKTRMDTKGNKTTANVNIESGTAPYTVEINGKTIDVTFENQLNIPVQNGDLLEIKTSVACEGKIRERVSLSNELMAYPNPTSNFVELFIPNTFQKKYVMIQMLDNTGKSVVNREFKVIDNSVIIPMETLSEGLYIINVQLETLQTIKIIKK